MGKQKRNKKQQHVEDDAFENPVARDGGRTFEDESGTATFEDESLSEDRGPTHLARSDLIAAGGASILTQDEAASKGCSWFSCAKASTFDTHRDSRSAVQFQEMQLVDAGSAGPQLHDNAGRALDILVGPKKGKKGKKSKKSVPRLAKWLDAEDEKPTVGVGKTVLLQRELDELHAEIRRRHEWEDGRAVSVERKDAMAGLMLDAAQIEKRLRRETARVAKEAKIALAEADRRAHAAGATRSIDPLQVGGAATAMEGDSSIPVHSNIFSIDEDGPLGIEWHYQGHGLPVIAGIRADGVAAHDDELRMGMVLSQYRQPKLGLEVAVDFEALKEASESASGSKNSSNGAVTRYLQASLEVAGRPLQLVFVKPGAQKIALLFLC